MRYIKLGNLSQSYSFLREEKPSNVWAFTVAETQAANRMMIHGIPHNVLETLCNESHAWTGWGFDNGKALLLFETCEDAMFARLRFGEISNV
jgi:hypothetical protein